MKSKLLLSLVAICGACAAFAQTDVQINEEVINPPGVDTGQEFIELYNPTSSPIDLSTYAIFAVEGDLGGGDANPGALDAYIRLSGTIPAGGFYLVAQDFSFYGLSTSTTPGFNRQDYATSTTTWALPNGGFWPSDLENATNSILLVKNIQLASGTTIAKYLSNGTGTDLDTDNDGVLDNSGNLTYTLVDGVGWTDGGTGDFAYGVGARVLNVRPVGRTGAAFTPSLFANIIGVGDAFFQFLGTSTPPATEADQIAFYPPSAPVTPYTVTPGAPNCPQGGCTSNGTAVTFNISSTTSGCSFNGKTVSVSVVGGSETATGTLDASGNVTVNLTTTGTQNLCVRVQGVGALSKVVNGVNLSGGAVSGGSVQVSLGDFDGNGSIDDIDLFSLTQDFLSTPGSASGNVLTDLDCSGFVDDFDLFAFTNNFLTSGDCQ